MASCSGRIVTQEGMDVQRNQLCSYSAETSFYFYLNFGTYVCTDQGLWMLALNYNTGSTLVKDLLTASLKWQLAKPVLWPIWSPGFCFRQT